MPLGLHAFGYLAAIAPHVRLSHTRFSASSRDDDDVTITIASSSHTTNTHDTKPRSHEAMSYFFSTPLDIDIRLDDNDDKRQMVDIKLEKNRKEKCPLYMDGETVKGAVTIRPKDGKRLEHTGIKVQFIGTIGLAPPRCGHMRSKLSGRARNVL